MRLKTMDLKHKLWVYFGLFAIIIMIILWLMQILLLNSFYETMKLAEIKRTGKKIVREYKENPSELADLVLDAHFKHGFFSGVFTEEGTPVFGAESNFSHRPPTTFSSFPEISSRLKSSKSDTVSFVFSDSSQRYNSVVFGAKLVDSNGKTFYLCLTSPLSPLGSTTKVLSLQLIIVTVMALIIAFVLSYFIAKRLAMPISQITCKAENFAKGDYSVTFEHGGYSEINQLADVLNHAATELDKTDTLRRDLVANVSHDLRTPLTIIRSYAEMIHDISGDNPEKRNQHAKVIIDEADRLSLLVNDMLDLSKIESGVATLDIKPFNIPDVIRNVINKFNVFSEKNGYTFNVVCDSSYVVLGDETRIHQVIYNLVSNAVNYTGSDKLVTVNTSVSGTGKLRISVTDTGTGISPEEQPFVWDRYYKSSSSHHRMQVGTGIGLSIVKNILTMHGSDYGIISEKGEGTTFWFELPFAKI